MKFYFKIDLIVNYSNTNFCKCHENNINTKLMVINLMYLKYNFLKCELDMFSRDSLEYINEMGCFINMFQISWSQHTTFHHAMMSAHTLIHLHWHSPSCAYSSTFSLVASELSSRPCLVNPNRCFRFSVCLCVRAKTGINPGHSIRLQSRSALVCGPEACH